MIWSVYWCYRLNHHWYKQRWLLNIIVFFLSRISDSLRTQPLTLKLLSPSVPWPIRFTAWCAHVVMPVKISPLFLRSCVRRKGSSNVGPPPARLQPHQFLALHRTRTAGCILPWGLWLFSLFLFFLQSCEKTKNKSSSFLLRKSPLIFFKTQHSLLKAKTSYFANTWNKRKIAFSALDFRGFWGNLRDRSPVIQGRL